MNPVFLLIASFPDSLINFRGALIESLISAGCEVHVAAPGLGGAPEISSKLRSLGVTIHNIPLQRVGMNP